MNTSQPSYSIPRPDALGAHLFTDRERKRFREKFSPGYGAFDCWIWTASLNAQGYGQFYFRGRPHKCHRLSYREFWGPIPDETPVIMHACDDRRCVNPFHLLAGTVTLNNLDRDQKNRNRIEAAHSVVYANRKARTACKHGHEYTPETMRLRYPKNRPGPTRICLVCKRAERRRPPT